MASDRRRNTTSAKAHSTPPPDDDRKPEAPPQLKRQFWSYSIKRAMREFGKDQCPDLAAALTYHSVLSVFPALLILVSLLGLIGQGEETASALLGVVRKVAPGSVDIIKDPIQQLTHAPSAGFALIAGVVVALVSASGYVGAFGRAMNRIYEIDEGRPVWKLRPTMIAVTLVAVFLVAVVALMLVVSGPIAEAAGKAIGIGDAGLVVWNIAKWPVIVGLLIVVIAILYYVTPNVKQPKFRWISVGSLVSLVVFALISLVFALYVANFSNYDKTYGTIGGGIVLLLWAWILNMSLLFGAELDSELERARELQGGIKAEEWIQLPPRDTKRSDKLHEKEQDEVAKGCSLREEYGEQDPDGTPRSH
ncbi:YihY/virulence factor BrkB family protein [Pseudarthrobacter sp. fls2-241-R2A-127]|uniref:YihY/virulence factor BrkB family protein n=1 Tax=Pseudarthrobacter sp. fls2-241-R2A-127 TaxID=3040303 RepID=UPI002553A2DB|nr:YihY/virulence factor BrkB family protein [Pseudarthrobacter sp. fls2-241-R2A-127]